MSRCKSIASDSRACDDLYRQLCTSVSFVDAKYKGVAMNIKLNALGRVIHDVKKEKL